MLLLHSSFSSQSEDKQMYAHHSPPSSNVHKDKVVDESDRKRNEEMTTKIGNAYAVFL